jgi:hypothetical protein
MDLAELTYEKAKAIEGTVFTIDLPDGTSIELKFDEALPFEVRQQQRRRGAAPKRDPFSMYFVGPVSPILPQAIYCLRGESTTIEKLFIVPVGQNERGTEYEAAFT